MRESGGMVSKYNETTVHSYALNSSLPLSPSSLSPPTLTCHCHTLPPQEVHHWVWTKHIQIDAHLSNRHSQPCGNEGAGCGGEDPIVPLVGSRKVAGGRAVLGEAEDHQTNETGVSRVGPEGGLEEGGRGRKGGREGEGERE